MLFARGVYAQQDEQQDGEAPERRTAVAEEGEGNTDYRTEANHHAGIDGQMEYEI